MAASLLFAVSCEKDPENNGGNENGPEDNPSGYLEAVDMGTGVLWASCNVGAYSAEEPGNYYAWGDTEVRTDYSWESYKFSTELHDGIHFTKYNDPSAKLDSGDDVARAVLGEPWRMPTVEEFSALKEKCTWTWEKRGNQEGYLVTSKSTNASIFLPAAGSIVSGNKVSAKNYFGKYWTNELRSDTPGLANNFTFTNSNIAPDSYPYRYLGFSVRAVRSAK